MLSIRMQRRGRKGHPTYRVVVQDSHQTPTSGKFVALLGSYDPHTKTTTLTKEKAEFYLKHGAQPTDRVVKLFTSEGIALPKWVKKPTEHSRTTRNPEKLRKNRPAEEVKEEPAEEPATEVEPEETNEKPAETAEAPADEASEDKAEAPKEETAEPVDSSDEKAKV